MIDSTVKPREPDDVEHVNDLTCPCLLAGYVCPNGHLTFMHGNFDVARVPREQGHP